MESPSNLRSLSQSLALKKAQDLNEVASVMNAELTKLGYDLQRQSSAVLTTTALSITQSASREMQTFEQQISPEITRVQRDMGQKLAKMQESISPEIDRMHKDMSEKLAQMQAQIDQQLRPLNERALKQRMGKLQGQINEQTKPLTDALATIKKDSEALALMTMKSWLKPALISVVILLSISLPVWGLTQYLANQVQSNLETIKVQTQALQQLQAQTWGVTMQQDSGGQFLILPAGTVADPGWKFGDRQGIKLLKK